MDKLMIKKCKKFGAMIKVLQDCKCEDNGIKCCGKDMEKLMPNSVEASVEKHVPTYEIKEGKIIVTVNHVMEDEHFIEWISIVRDKKECITYLEPGEVAVTSCKYVPGTVIYAYCNKHGLWKKEVEGE